MHFLENFVAPWLTVAASLYATTLLLCLGALVVFSAARQGRNKRDGVWAGIGLLLAGIAMGAHTAMLDYPVEVLLDNIGAWWRPLWVAMIVVPGGWAALALVYAGYFQRTSPIRARTRSVVWFCIFLGSVALAAGIGIEPRQIALQFASLERATVSGVMLALCAGYAGYLVLCLALATVALLRPDASGRLLRDLARRRARPYLLGATAALGLAAACVLGIFGWAAWLALRNPSLGTVNQLNIVFDALELSVASLACVAVACVGKAVASFEIFSGLALPRAAIAGSWRAIATSLGIFSLVVAAFLGLESKGVYTIMAAACTVAVVVAWQAARLDATQRALMTMPGNFAPDTSSALESLETILDARAELRPAGAIAALLGEVFGVQAPSRETVFVAPEKSGEAWSLPLWRGADFMGVLRLWPRRANALFTEDAVALARSVGEKILEARASHALSQQLIEVQKRAARQGETLDAAIMLGGRTRRALHDELLPRIHAALLDLAALPDQRATSSALAEAHKLVSDILRDAPPDATEELARFGLWSALERAASTEFDRTPIRVEWNISEQARSTALSNEREETLYHAAREALRNVRRYARGDDEKRAVAVDISARFDGEMRIVIEDDGVGMAARLPSKGGGHGLVLHGALLAVAGGALLVEERGGGGTRVALHVPL